MQCRPTRILLAGATGYIGRAVAAELLDRGYEVIVVTRSAIEITGVEVRVAAVTDSAALAEALDGMSFDAVVSCIASRSGVPEDAWRVDCDANRNLLELAIRSGAQHFVLLSAICVQKPRLAFQHAKLAFEDELRRADIAHSIVRPTAFFKSLSGQIERVRAGKPFLTFGDGTLTACKPIGEADLACFLVNCLDDPSARNATLPIGGPGEAITPRQQGELLFELTGMPARFRSVPPGMFLVVNLALTPLGWVWPAARRKAELAKIGHYYATESMLLWDEKRLCYDAEKTPSTGTTTLGDFYAEVVERGLDGQSLGDHKVF